MGDVINLRQVRKAKKRADEEGRADANRAKYGRSKTEKRRDEAAKQRLNAVVDGARRERADD